MLRNKSQQAGEQNAKQANAPRECLFLVCARDGPSSKSGKAIRCTASSNRVWTADSRRGDSTTLLLRRALYGSKYLSCPTSEEVPSGRRRSIGKAKMECEHNTAVVELFPFRMDCNLWLWLLASRPPPPTYLFLSCSSARCDLLDHNGGCWCRMAQGF